MSPPTFRFAICLAPKAPTGSSWPCSSWAWQAFIYALGTDSSRAWEAYVLQLALLHGLVDGGDTPGRGDLDHKVQVELVGASGEPLVRGVPPHLVRHATAHAGARGVVLPLDRGDGPRPHSPEQGRVPQRAVPRYAECGRGHSPVRRLAVLCLSGAPSGHGAGQGRRRYGPGASGVARASHAGLEGPGGRRGPLLSAHDQAGPRLRDPLRNHDEPPLLRLGQCRWSHTGSAR